MLVNSVLVRPQVRKFVSQYGGALIEEFIAGREFTVLVVEGHTCGDCGADSSRSAPIALQPVECVFEQGA
jgi:D-alanine-D-alanine ligase